MHYEHPKCSADCQLGYMAIDFLVHLERFELSCLSAQPPQGCVYTSSTTDAGRGSRTRTCGVSEMWRLYRPLSSLLDVIPRSLRDYQANKIRCISS